MSYRTEPSSVCEVCLLNPQRDPAPVELALMVRYFGERPQRIRCCTDCAVRWVSMLPRRVRSRGRITLQMAPVR